MAKILYFGKILWILERIVHVQQFLGECQSFILRLGNSVSQRNRFYGLPAKWRTFTYNHEDSRLFFQLFVRVDIISITSWKCQFKTNYLVDLLFFKKRSGVYSDPACIVADENDVDHAVVIVGYGTTTATATVPATPYWIVRNSWGTGWGLSGYFLIKRGVNMCNIESWTAYVRVVWNAMNNQETLTISIPS